MTSPALIAGLLWIGDIVTSAEAVKIQIELTGKPVPKDWKGFVEEIEKIIGRTIKPIK